MLVACCLANGKNSSTVINSIDGKYTENIEFFSRDNNRVGASLSFDYEIKEKIEIAKRHLLPKQLEEHSLDKSDLKLGAAALKFLIKKIQGMIHFPIVHPIYHSKGKHVLASGDAFIVKPQVLKRLACQRGH